MVLGIMKENNWSASTRSLSTLIKTCLRQNSLSDAMTVLQIMEDTKTPLDNHIVTDFFTYCGKHKHFREGKKVHDYAISSKLELDYLSLNMLAQFYAKCNRLQDGMTVFTEMTSKRMSPNDYTYFALLYGCISDFDIQTGKIIHNCMRETNHVPNLMVANALIQLYIKCGDLNSAVEVFYTYTKRVAPDDYTFGMLFSGCTKSKAYDLGKAVHENMVARKFKPSEHTINVLLKFYVNCDKLDDAMDVFQGMIAKKFVPSEYTYSTLLAACAEVKAHEHGNTILKTMRTSGFKHTLHTYTALIRFFVECDQLDEAIPLFSDMILKKMPCNYPASAIIAACKDVKIAKKMYQQLLSAGQQPDLQTRSALLQCYALCEYIDEATEVYHALIKDGFIPDEYTYTILFNMCGDTRLDDFGSQLFSDMPTNFLQNEHLANSAITMFSKIMEMQKARTIFDRMENKTVVSWSAIIGGYGINGEGSQALLLYHQMQKQAVMPNRICLVNVLSACSHAHMHKEALEIYNNMPKYGINTDVQIDSIIVDTLARSGLIDEAIEFAKKMNEINVVTWMEILGACRTQLQVKQGAFAASQVFALDRKYVAAYITLANLYAEAKMYKEAEKVKKEMEDLRLVKEPGITCIEHKGKRYKFYAQALSPELEQEIETGRTVFLQKLHDAGYIINTSVVTDNVDDETKKMIACQHSEKSALIFKLGRTKNEKSPIKMFKNLRICTDCHNATAIASKVYQREIRMQDRRRTHIFTNGVCSCNNKW
jgi:pentatricopeptide repeat protein